MRTRKEYRLTSNDRKGIRRELIDLFLDEEPGTGTGEDCSHYIYDVEELANGAKVFLKRPALFNKGFDFEVHVEGIIFGKKTMPSHDNLYDDLLEKAEENPNEYKKVKNIIDRLYKCEHVSDDEMRNLQFTNGHPIEAILKSIKWLFIEQDVTYWNWSGRSKLYSYINDI